MPKAYLVVKKVSTAPSVGEPNTLYLLQDGIKLRIYCSNAAGTAVGRIMDETDTNSLINTILTLLSGQPDGLATLDASSKVEQTALTADKWASAITLLLKGDVGGSVVFDGSGSVEMFVSKPHSPVLSYDGQNLYKIVYSDGSIKNISYSGGYPDTITKTLGERIFFTRLNYDIDGNLVSAPMTELTQSNMLAVGNIGFDFTSEFPPQLSFTRNSVQERITQSGSRELMPINSPCIDHTLQGQPLGLLIEPSQTNIIPYSNEKNSWQKLFTTVSENTQQGVRSLVNAATVVETTGNGLHGIKSQPFSTAAGASYTFITKLKATNRSFIKVELGDSGDDFVNCFLIGNLSTLEVWNTTGLTRYSFVPDCNGFVYVSITAVAAITSTTAYAYIFLRNDAVTPSYVGDISKSIIATDSMVLMNSDVDTGYIPTDATLASRSTQLVSCSGNDFDELFGTSGTIFIETVSKIIPASSNQILLSLDDGTSVNAVRLIRKSLTTVTLRVIVSSVVDEVDIVVPSSLSSKMVLIWGKTYFELWSYGQLMHTFSNLTPTVDRFRLGSSISGSTFIGHVKQLRVWRNIMLTSAMAQQLSL